MFYKNSTKLLFSNCTYIKDYLANIDQKLSGRIIFDFRGTHFYAVVLVVVMEAATGRLLPFRSMSCIRICKLSVIKLFCGDENGIVFIWSGGRRVALMSLRTLQSNR